MLINCRLKKRKRTYINHPLAWSWGWVSVSVEKPDTADNQQDEDEHRDHHTGYRGITCPCKKKNINSDKTIKNITMEYTGFFFKGGGGW